MSVRPDKPPEPPQTPGLREPTVIETGPSTDDRLFEVLQQFVDSTSSSKGSKSSEYRKGLMCLGGSLVVLALAVVLVLSGHADLGNKLLDTGNNAFLASIGLSGVYAVGRTVVKARGGNGGSK